MVNRVEGLTPSPNKKKRGKIKMRKAKTTIVTYKDNTIWSLDVITCKGNKITLMSYDEIDIKHPYKDRTFAVMQQSVINICKNNGFYIPHKIDFGCKVYDIMYFDIERPENGMQIMYCTEDKGVIK